MNKEEIREYLIAKRTPISHCVDLTKYFIGRHKTLPIFLTPAFEMEFNRSMQELEILREQVKKQKEVIDKVKIELEQGITFCKNDSQGLYDKCNIAINREQIMLDILKEVK